MRRLLVTTCVGATLCLGCNQALTTNAKTDGSPVGDVASVVVDASPVIDAPTVVIDASPVIDAPTVDVDLGYCGNLPLSECENDELCWLTCGTAPGLGPTAGCALACGNRPCTEVPVERCELHGCVVMTNCSGQAVCTSPFSAPPPACGPLSYYGQAVACCAGLVRRCGAALADGSCDMTAGGYNGFAQCLACGDGRCDSAFENRCNCPEDCGP